MTYSYNPLASLGLDKSIPLDGSGKIPSGYLPSYVDDVIEYDDLASFPGTGETGKIYVAKDTGYTYRWTGSVYVRIGSGGEVALNLGSDSSPSLYFTGDTNTGIYSPGADQLALSTNGTKRIEIQADGDIDIDGGGVFYDASTNRLAIGTTSPSFELHVHDPGTGSVDTRLHLTNGDTGTSAADGFQIIANGSTAGYAVNLLQRENGPLAFWTNNTERARIDSSGRLLVGTSSTSISNRLQVNANAEAGGAGWRPVFSLADASTGITQSGKGAPFIHYLDQFNGVADLTAIAINRVNAPAGNSGLQFEFNSTVNSLAAGTRLGRFVFSAHDGTSLIPAARIEAFVDGTPGANDMPGRLVFSVTADGAASPTEALRISNNRAITVSDGGNIVLGTGTGTKIGTSTSQKIGFFDETPIVQPTTGIAEAAFVENSGGTAVNVDSTFGGYTIQQVVQALQNLGLLA